jgi:hypothetical protein
MEPSKLQHRVTRTRVNGCKLLEFGVLYCPLWIRSVLVGPRRPPSARAQEGQLKAPHRIYRSRRFPYLQPCVSSSVSSNHDHFKLGGTIQPGGNIVQERQKRKLDQQTEEKPRPPEAPEPSEPS